MEGYFTFIVEESYDISRVQYENNKVRAMSVSNLTKLKIGRSFFLSQEVDILDIRQMSSYLLTILS